jgi:chemotaxis protein CheX
MLDLEVQPETPFIQHTALPPQDGVEGLVGFAGQCAGTGTLSCTAGLACFLSSCFLATPMGTVDEAVLDAMGELTNMIIGNFKNALEEQIGPLAMSIPTVVSGKEVMTRAMRENDWIVVPFLIHGERLSVRVCFASHSGQKIPGGAGSLPLGHV